MLVYQAGMPRRSRIDAPGAIHHVIVRGIERRKIFLDDRDRNDFLDRLGKILADTGTPCYAWSLLQNHAHMLLRTGATAIPTVMRRLLTGYAVSFNHRHKRHGQLFQNRYKSILCQEDAYLLELVRYIHLNPLRAKLVPDLNGLDRYGYAGHKAIMGKEKREWQDVPYVLKLFDGRIRHARERYREFVEKGVSLGRRSDLTGGGLIRSAGGWGEVMAFRHAEVRLKGDERILGDSDFVERILKAGDERLERKYEYRARGYDFDWLVQRVAEVFGMEVSQVLRGGRYPETVKARRVLCFWATRTLGMTTVELSRKLKLSQPTVSQSVLRGERIIEEKGLRLPDVSK